MYFYAMYFTKLYSISCLQLVRGIYQIFFTITEQPNQAYVAVIQRCSGRHHRRQPLPNVACLPVFLLCAGLVSDTVTTPFK